MQVSKATEYAVRAMMYLAMNGDKEVSQIMSISKTWDVPEKFLRKISGQLSKHNLIKTARGLGGGIKLAKDADKITLLDIVKAMESSVNFNKCICYPEECDNSKWCPVLPVWKEAQRSFNTILGGVTLKQLVSGQEFIGHFNNIKN